MRRRARRRGAPSARPWRRTRSTSMPAPSSAISMLTGRPRGTRAAQRALGGLAGGGATSGVSMPWSTRVADEVRERILDRLDDALVELGPLALGLEADLLAAGEREVADDARVAAPQVIDRLHARLHHALLQLGRDEVEPLRGGDEPDALALARVLEELVARQDELADEVHEPVEERDVHADCGDRGAARASTSAVSRSDRGSRVLSVMNSTITSSNSLVSIRVLPTGPGRDVGTGLRRRRRAITGGAPDAV
jgi:hypothetical protein